MIRFLGSYITQRRLENAQNYSSDIIFYRSRDMLINQYFLGYIQIFGFLPYLFYFFTIAIQKSPLAIFP